MPFLPDIRVAWRQFQRRRAQTAVVLLTLTLALGANAAVFTVLHGVLLAPLPYPDPDRLVTVNDVQTNTGLRGQPVAVANLRDWEAASRGIARFAAVRTASFTLTGHDEPERVAGLRVSPSLLATLGVRPARGRDFAAAEGVAGRDAVALISHAFWTRRFGADPGVVGRTLPLDGRPVEIVGVLPEGMRHPGIRIPPDGSDVWVPLVPTAAEERRFFHSVRVVARLRGDVTRDQAEDELEAIAAALARKYPDTNTNFSVELVPLHEALTAETRPVLWFLGATVSFLLLLACLNIATITLVSSAARSGEFAIRLSIGARPVHLLRQLFTEGALLAGIGGGAGLLIAHWLVPVLVRLGDANIPRGEELHVRAETVWWMAGLTVVAALVLAAGPAMALRRVSGLAALGLRKGSSATAASPRLLQGLVIAEVALGLLLLVGTGLMTQSLTRAASTPSGFDPVNVTTASLTLPLRAYPDQASQARLLERYLQVLDDLPGIERAGIIMRVPLVGAAATAFTVRGTAVAAGQEPWADYRTASEETFATLRIPVLAGRAFTAADTVETEDVVIVNQALAERFWPGEAALDKFLQIGNERTRWRRVVGVVGDVRLASLEKPAEPAIYVPYRQNTWVNALALGAIVVRATDGRIDPAPLARRALKGIDPGLALGEVRALEEVVQRSLGRRRFSTVLVSLFGVLGYVLATLGVYGVVCTMVTQRGYELAIRAALGASATRTFASVVARGAVLASAGCAVGLLATASLGPKIGRLLYEVTPWDPLTLTAAVTLLVAVSVVACAIPARRAMRADPLMVLRGEP